MPVADCIVHLQYAGPQALATSLAARGWTLREWLVGRDDLDALDPAAADLLIVLGGPMSVYRPGDFPCVAQEARIIERRLAADRALLGSCMGAQLMAHVLGARVYRAPRPEAGWLPLTLTDAGRASPLAPFDGLPVLHWHGDTFDLPAGAQWLASTPNCAHQAFSHGPRALACQFHLEAQAGNAEQWLMGHVHHVETLPGLDYPTLRADFARHGPPAAQAATRAFNAWLDAATAA